jgi:hypothetical protein
MKSLLTRAGLALALEAVVLGTLFTYHAYRQKAARGRLVSQEHYDLITEGMSRAEVEDILGGPPGDFTMYRVISEHRGLTVPQELALSNAAVLWDDRGPGRREYWVGNRALIVVHFDEHDRVQRVSLVNDLVPVPPSFVDRVRAWLRRVRS